MGTIAARDCLRVLQLTEQVASATLLACCQGVELRIRQRDVIVENLAPEITAMIESVRTLSPFLDEDRALDTELLAVIDSIQEQQWTIYDETDDA